jgi:Zn-dependent protease
MANQDRILLDREVKDFLIAIFVLFSGYVISIYVDARFPISSLPLVLLVSFFSIVLAFSAHEGAHRFMAIRLGAIAFFKKWNLGLLLIIVSSLVGSLFATAGAVQFTGITDESKIGKSALAGPATNLIIGTSVYGIYLLGGFSSISLVGFLLINIFRINLWLGLFNMIPIPPIDGSKVFRWDLKIFVIVIVIAVALNLISGSFL